MIQLMCEQLQTILHRREWPIRVHYGPEYQTQQDFSERILISRDRGTGDTVLPARGQQSNPRRAAVRNLACIARIWAKSPTPGAMRHNHEERGEDIVDAFITTLQEWGKDARAAANMAELITSVTPVATADLNDVQTWPGEVYDVRFFVPRAVLVETGEGAARPTVASPGFSNTTNVYRQAAPEGATPEVGCEPPA